jgi:hypothetical protein
LSHIKQDTDPVNEAMTMAKQHPRTRRNSILGRQIPLQHTMLAGFRHHDAPSLWPALGPREPLDLRREADNPHDPQAVALLWRGRKLGYLPRRENLVAARLLDRSRNLSARIARVDPKADYNRRIAVEVLLH